MGHFSCVQKVFGGSKAQSSTHFNLGAASLNAHSVAILTKMFILPDWI